MPIPADVVRCRVVFDLGAGNNADIAVMGFHLHRLHQSGNTTDWQADVQEIADKIADKWVARMTNKSQFSPDIKARVVETYHLDAGTGLTLHKGQTAMTGARAWVGSSGSASLPFAVAVAVSMYGYQPGSFTPNKRSKQGRMYLPPCSVAIMDSGTAAGLIQAGNANVLSAAVTAFLDDINGLTVGSALNGALTPDIMELVVLSRAKLLTTQVKWVRLGHRPDTQRRRQNKLPETYLETTLTAA